MTTKALGDDREVDAALAALVTRCLKLIDDKEPQGLVLLRELRAGFAELYVALIRLPGLGIYSAMTWLPPAGSPSREETGIRNQLVHRLPAELYWSALRPLTWETVADRGVELVADALIGLRQELMAGETPKPPSLLRDEVPTLGGPILAAVTIFQELVSDLEAYKRADESKPR